MKILTNLLIAAALVAIGAIGFAYSGLYDVRASSPHSGPVSWLLSTTSHASIERQANDVSVPDLSDIALAQAGVNDFDAMCAGCHGAPGKNPEAMGQGLNPPAPDLVVSAAQMNPAELFWVTKYGIKMTGMPAWGATHGDDALWPVVAFMTTLPDLDAEGYQALLASATGMGHHAGDAGTTPANGDDEHGHDDAAPATLDHHDAPDAPPHDHDEAEAEAAPATLDHHDAPDAPPHTHDEPAPKSEAMPHEDGHEH